MKKKHIHFVGIKGVGNAPLAIIAKEAGLTVTGCDVAEVFITDAALKKAGIAVQHGFSPDHLEEVDLVVTTGAHGGFDNPEVKAAKEKNIPVLTQGEAVGKFMDGSILGRSGMTGVSVAGVHGKTTTTAMVATVLKHTGLNPSFVVGTSDIPSLDGAGHFGKGNIFVAEADEYATEPTHDPRAKFLWQHPKIAVITNIEHDHPDVYPDVEAMRESFLEFARQLPTGGTLILSGDDPQLQLLKKEYNGRTITYGMSQVNDYVLQRVRISGDRMFFWLETKTASLGEFMLNVTGEHNAQNATAAIIAASELGVNIAAIKKALLHFKGSKRRLEFLGALTTGALFYDDYAHHPTEIRKTLAALRAMYPKKQIVSVFQPHTYSRTKSLYNEFTRAFEDADRVVLTDIYASMREAADPEISSRKLAIDMSKWNKAVEYLPSLDDVVEYIEQNRFRNDTVVVIMGAGDVYKIAEQLSFTDE